MLRNVTLQDTAPASLESSPPGLYRSGDPTNHHRYPTCWVIAPLNYMQHLADFIYTNSYSNSRKTRENSETAVQTPS